MFDKGNTAAVAYCTIYVKDHDSAVNDRVQLTTIHITYEERSRQKLSRSSQGTDNVYTLQKKQENQFESNYVIISQSHQRSSDSSQMTAENVEFYQEVGSLCSTSAY